MFKSSNSNLNFPEMEKNLLDKWYKTGIVEKYLHKNDDSKETFSFIDGPITANNPMGIHHAWGRTYKDLYQKFNNLLGKKQRFQSGFDCQGLWVEVEVEKELGLRNKKDIENLVEGDKKASIAKFVQLCKDRVIKYSDIQTDQSKRLGYFMNWDNSYFTMSDNNNYMIWHFLKKCYENGWIYKGKDSVPWCPRCETAISQHEMLTEDYKEISHETVFLKLKILDPKFENTFLLVWTTTPWTVPANVGVGINTKYNYAIWENESTKEKIIILDSDQSGAMPTREHKKKLIPISEYIFGGLTDKYTKVKTIKADELLGLKYEAPFDYLEIVKKVRTENEEKFHVVVDASEVVTSVEGTGLLHLAPGAGTEDFKVGKKEKMPLLMLIADNADYISEMGEFAGLNAKKHPELIIDKLKELHAGSFLLKTMHFMHRYPACWRCKAELVWKVADEWYIAMDKPSNIKSQISNVKYDLTLRERMVEVAKKIAWMPEFGLDRELDWLKNMHDWLISKKNRYWGLSLPIFECSKCGNFEVIGSKEELKERAVSGFENIENNSPHKPFTDQVFIKCGKCGAEVQRIDDVGNPWLDAGIVPYSTLIDPKTGKMSYVDNQEYWKSWFPANFITESFPGQFKNWFYSMIAMSSVLELTNPFERVLGFATLTGEDGRPMHKSWGNSIEFNEGADRIGVDVIRWLFTRQDPANNLGFGYKKTDEVRRLFYLMLWNTYKFFVDYANLDNYQKNYKDIQLKSENILDKWILERLKQITKLTKEYLLAYNTKDASLEIESFVSDLSTWYLRRSRDRVWTNSDDSVDKTNFYETLHFVLVNLSIILSPFMPFLADEMYANLTGEESVHLADWPNMDTDFDEKLIADMKSLRELVEVGHRVRRETKMKVKQPLGKLSIFNYPIISQFSNELIELIKGELNVKNIEFTTDISEGLKLGYDLNITDELKREGEIRELIRSIQEERKKLGLQPTQKIDLVVPEFAKNDLEFITKKIMAREIKVGEVMAVTVA